MLVDKKSLLKVVVSCCLFAGLFVADSSFAADIKVAVVDMQKVLLSSEVGKKAQKKLDEKAKALQAEMKKEADALAEMQKEIEKKSSVWDEEVKQEKIVAFQKKRRGLAMKEEDARLELKQLQDKVLAPIMQDLKDVIKKAGKEGGYEVILPKSMVLYHQDSADLTDAIAKQLDKVAK